MKDPIVTTLVANLAAARQELLEVLHGLDENDWQTTVFSDEGEWTVLDLVRHLAGAEHSMTRLMEIIRQDGEGASPDFDLNRWNASQVRKQQQKTADEILADLSANRVALLAFMASLTPDEWEKRGRHGSGRIMSIYEITALIGTHERSHVHDIRATLPSA